MPRETVVYGTSYTLEDGDKVEERKSPDVNVHWNRETEWAQLAFTVDRKLLKDLLAAQGGSSDRVQIPSNILDRKELNHLIRTLRRARDGAYGSDE